MKKVLLLTLLSYALTAMASESTRVEKTVQEELSYDDIATNLVKDILNNENSVTIRTKTS